MDNSCTVVVITLQNQYKSTNKLKLAIDNGINEIFILHFSREELIKKIQYLKNQIEVYKLNMSHLWELLQPLDTDTQQLWSMKIEALDNCAEQFEKSINHAMMLNNINAQAEERKRAKRTAPKKDHVSQLLDHQNSLNKSHQIAQEAVEFGKNLWSSLKSQTSKLKSVNDRTLDINYSIAQSQKIVKRIGNKNRNNILLFCFFALFTLFLIFFLYYYVKPKISEFIFS